MNNQALVSERLYAIIGENKAVAVVAAEGFQELEYLMRPVSHARPVLCYEQLQTIYDLHIYTTFKWGSDSDMSMYDKVQAHNSEAETSPSRRSKLS